MLRAIHSLLLRDYWSRGCNNWVPQAKNTLRARNFTNQASPLGFNNAISKMILIIVREILFFQGQEAQDYLDKHPLVLTDAESQDLSNAVMKSHFQEVERMYNYKISELKTQIITKTVKITKSRSNVLMDKRKSKYCLNRHSSYETLLYKLYKFIRGKCENFSGTLQQNTASVTFQPHNTSHKTFSYTIKI